MCTQSLPLIVTVVVLVNPPTDLPAMVEGFFGVDQTENMALHLHLIRPHL